MIPIRDNIPSRTHPVVNTTLIGISVAAFLYELSLGAQLEGFIHTWGLIPARCTYALRSLGAVGRFYPCFTSLFLHGGWMHIIGNMLYLWIFGDNVEDRLGHSRYGLFYIACGVAANLAHTLVHPSSAVPTIGASGCIAGVMGAYLVLYPKARVLTLVPFFFFIHFVEIPAFFFLGIWFVIQFLVGTASYLGGVQGGVAWWAHVGGFLMGLVLVFVLRKPKRRYRRYPDEYWPW